MLELAPFIEAATPLRALGVVVSQNGRETARHTWEGPAAGISTPPARALPPPRWA